MSTLEKVIEEVKTLAPQDLQRVRELVDSLLSEPGTTDAEEEFERELTAEGVLVAHADLRQANPGPVDRRSFKPVPVTGKLVSELVVEERR